ncbi:hypothetical protein TRFO_30226 [Tritrichomonas foetus]|uniref:DUF3447 domain-containing protein n=1 Tax=Tritrichomonas foetus TaxID=1144522 RepID=A0A1J4JVV7_9EUKA|nr:hypothetical protein TRFO_30226 [Tritrichomonas foetus]|eukprot:OHT02568.1 hypothetical protein TRFO_30226 [Tritrichomonas foetus]
MEAEYFDVEEVAFLQTKLLNFTKENTKDVILYLYETGFFKTKGKKIQFLDSIQSAMHSRPLKCDLYFELISIFVNELKEDISAKWLYDKFQKFPKLLRLFEKNDILNENILSNLKNYYNNSSNKSLTFEKIEDMPFLHEDTFHQSIQTNNIQLFTEIYHSSNNIDLNQKVEYSKFGPNIEINNSAERPSLISYAAFFGAEDIFKYLLLNNAKINEKVPPYAVAGGCTEIIHILEEKKIPFGEDAINAAIEYNRNDIVNYLNSTIEIQLNLRHLFTAIQSYNLNFFLDIIKDVNVNSKIGLNGKTVLHFAVELKRLDIIMYLSNIPGIDFEATNIHGLSPIELAINLGYRKIVEYFITIYPEVLPSAFISALKNTSEKIITLLLNMIDINKPLKNDENPLCLACQYNELEVVKKIISNKDCDINYRMNNGKTAFHIAAENGNSEILKVLSESENIDLNITEKSNEINSYVLFYSTSFSCIK